MAAGRAHNWTARAANGTSSTTLMAIHDERNIPVFGWPRSMEMLAQGYRRELPNLSLRRRVINDEKGGMYCIYSSSMERVWRRKGACGD